MAQSNRKRSGKAQTGGRQSHIGPAAAPIESPIPSGLFALGLTGLIAAIAGSGLLVWQHLSGLDLPGCGPGSGCAEATASKWGTIPGVGWPTSHLGLAIFVGLLIGWIASRAQGVSNGLLWIIRLGAIASVVLTIAMFAGGYVCKYCLLAHGGNLLFWLSAELARRGAVAGAAPHGRGLTAALAVFALATVALVPVEVIAGRAAEGKAAQELKQSTDKIIGASSDQRKAFTGRYLLGPEKAAIRIVALTDYQCPDCKDFETELREVMNGRDDISLSVINFPMSSKCNRFMGTYDMHPNACMAARAAEAAGILGGNDGFWKMHHWLFDQGGTFTDATFPGQLRELGYDSQEFIKTMTSQQTLDLVQKDIEFGASLGQYFTPMVFINGVELRGAHFKGNLTRAIERITAENPRPMTIAEANDTPPTAEQKYVNDWKASGVFPNPADNHSFPLGENNPKLEIVVWGDYQEPMTGRMNTFIRKRMKVQNGIRYTFRHYPFDQSCNENITETKHPQACLAARCVEAAGMIGGSDAWWTMHESMFANAISLRPDLISGIAEQLRLDTEVHALYMNSDRVDEAIAEDILGGLQRGLANVGVGIPLVFINGKMLSRLTLVDQRLGIEFIFDDALGPLTDSQKQRMNEPAQPTAQLAPNQVGTRAPTQQPAPTPGLPGSPGPN